MEYWCEVCRDYWAAVGVGETSVCICCHTHFEPNADGRSPERDYTVEQPCPVHPAQLPTQ